jgi:hypothetical protein
MSPFSRNSIPEEMFPQMTFKIRVGVLGFCDIDDIAEQFQ